MKKVIRLIATILVVSIIVVGSSFLIEGVPLFGTPDVEKVERIIVEHADYPNEVKEYTDNDKIELAIALLGNLKYSPLKGLTDDNRLITITYIMDDGTECVVSANNYTVWWNGKPSAIKNEKQFVKLFMAIFYPEKELIYGEIQEPSNSDIIHGEGEAIAVKGDYPAAIMVDDIVYYLAYAMPAEIDESAIVGYTTSYTDEMPQSNGETNFNRELNMPYARVSDGIAILYENEWWLCKP